jgi:alanine dehydrogenase
VVDDVVHYCVANMPGAVSLTSTLALTSTTLAYGLRIADMGALAAVRDNAELKGGLNVYRGVCTCAEVAGAFGLAYSNPDTLV